MAHRITLGLGSLLLALGLVACGVSADWSGAFSLVGLALLALPLTSPARAGAPVQCDGYEVTSCQSGYVRTSCCPKNAKCNFDFPSFTSCGNSLCVLGDDPGRCPAPTPMVDESKKSAADCSYGWETACVKHKVTKACILPVPTNYTGPARNPAYRTCGDNRCTTHTFIEDCFPTKAELGSKACDGTWTKVCLGGTIAERCIKPVPDAAFNATTFTTCPDKSCVVGPSASTCPK